MPNVNRAALDALLDHFGPQHWWPGDSAFEIVLGAILTQNTSWQNVERAIGNLREADLLDVRALAALDPEELAHLIRPAGYFRIKARRLGNFLRWLMDRYDGSLDAMFAQSTSTLREELLAINGIGPETADSILLYAAGKPTFVVDAYTHRISVRHGWIEPEAGYDELKEYFEGRFPADVPLYNELHALIVATAKTYCHKRSPHCDACPLRPFLPEGGIVQPEF
jgi:endonuclease-3 related protein